MRAKASSNQWSGPFSQNSYTLRHQYGAFWRTFQAPFYRSQEKTKHEEKVIFYLALYQLNFSLRAICRLREGLREG